MKPIKMEKDGGVKHVDLEHVKELLLAEGWKVVEEKPKKKGK